MMMNSTTIAPTIHGHFFAFFFGGWNGTPYWGGTPVGGIPAGGGVGAPY